MLQEFWNVVRNFLRKVFDVFSKNERINDASMLKINVRVGSNQFVPLEVDQLWTIGRVKEVLGPKVNLEPGQIRVIFAGHELNDATKIEDCDIGQHSVIHVVRGEIEVKTDVTEEEEPSKPNSLASALRLHGTDLDLRTRTCSEELKKVHFFVYCTSPCKNVCHGKLRVRCSICKMGTLTVQRDPCCWEDVLTPNRIEGTCLADDCNGNKAEFFFKCANHSSSEVDGCVALYLIRANLRNVPCLACMEVSNPVLVFECSDGHLLCLSCFQEYCISRLSERRFVQDIELGYTLPCPVGCDGSLVRETHHFRLLGDEHYERYHRFGAEECLIQAGGVLCPQPGCGAGIIPDLDCRRVVCIQRGGQGCGFVFCKNCLQGFHIGDCDDVEVEAQNTIRTDSFRTELSQWDEASKITIKVMTKPCPKCRTPTERDGGCMHMVCGRSNCGFHWCWICQQEWTRDCMGSHWFG